jgi:hypothetical protein
LAAPRVGPLARRDLGARSPLILNTSANAPSLREGALHPEVELHPATADIVGTSPSQQGNAASYR